MLLTATAIFLVTLVLVMVQPRGLNVGVSAALGAAAALLFGIVNWADVLAVTGIVWNATLTFVALIIISLVLDEVGFFHWSALHMARAAGGDGRRVFVYSILLGAVVSALFANDGAALILTPIIYEMVQTLRFSPAAVLAFVMAGGFIADTASLPLVVSNLVNIVSADYFGLNFNSYAARMALPYLASVAASTAVLWLFFRRQIPAAYDLQQLPAPAAAIKDGPLFRAGLISLTLLVVGYFAGALFRLPVSAVAGLVAVALLLLSGQRRRSGAAAAPDPMRILRAAPWHIVLFSLGMYLVVYGLRNAGLTTWLTSVLQWGTGLFAGAQPAAGTAALWGGVLTTGVVTAGLSSVMNNMPTVMVGALAIDPVQADPVTRLGMVLANVIGCDLGPKITPIGSLATLLWLHVLARKGLNISWGYYFRVGITLVPPVLLITLAALALTL